MAAKKKAPIDPLLGVAYALEGRVVTMNNAFRVIDRGRVYISGGVIRAVSEATATPPAEFSAAPIIKTNGTLFPGLIELHNHLSYNALQLWQVPRVFAHRGLWSSHPDKRRLISQPMSVLAGVGGMIEGLVRYVEAKCLVGGVTTSQGLTLVADAGIEHHYRGLVRNVEATDDDTLPEALTRIADVDSASAFKKRLVKAQKSSLLLHLAEGGPAARKHFLNLQLPDKSWAISPSLVGIHSAGLEGKDFDVMAQHGGSIVWSPLSNLLLYARTCDVKRAKQAGVMLALGSDWSPSGSKNLLSELKVARAWSERQGGIFSPRELVAMATINPARMIKWDAALGSLAPDKRADILVLKGKAGDPYEQLLKSLEDDIAMVFINGVPRFGQATAMTNATHIIAPTAAALEKRTMGGAKMAFNFVPIVPDPLVSPVTLAEAERRLTNGLRNLPDLASGLADPAIASAQLGVLGATTDGGTVRRWTLALDNEPGDGSSALGGTERPLAPWDSEPRTSPFGGDALAFNASAAANLISMDLDRLSIVEDEHYFERLGTQSNLNQPDIAGFAAAIAKLHGASAPSAPSGTVVLPPVSDSPDQESPALPRSLSELANLEDALTPEDRVELVKRLRAALEDFYVHLPLKRAAHAVDPVQRLRVLQYALEENQVPREWKDLDFHKEILAIFTELRDLHTQYLLPPPYNELTVFLPFLLEQCYDPPDENGKRSAVYLVTKVAASLKHPSFVPGVELLYWNGMPIETAIKQNADRHGGSNLAARFARGLASMTIRPLARSLPPEEEWVVLTYRAKDKRLLEIRLPWQIRSLTSTGTFVLPPLSAQSVRAALQKSPRARHTKKQDLAALASFAIDGQMEAINGARLDLYGRKRRRRRIPPALRTASGAVDLPTRMPHVLRARILPTRSGRIGYLRIYTFVMSDADQFIKEVVGILKQMPKSGVILDVRNNGGGLIWAAEQLLQLFTDSTIEPEPAQFINSPATLALARHNAPSTVASDLDLKVWIDSMLRSVVTASVHSEGFPITPRERANNVGRKYKGPVALITDALAYSATDMFAAGFQDHELGPIVGVDDNTGAGGANVWPYALLQSLLTPESGAMLSLPGGCDLRLAMRRTLRVGKANRGLPLEDLGVVPDERYFLTRRDVLDQNEDLIMHVAALLSRRRRHAS